MTAVVDRPLALQHTAPVLATVATGLGGGLALGVVARAWMRLIAERPEFTWGGTISIVVGFGIFGLTQSIGFAVRRRTKRKWAVRSVRVLGTIGLLPLFVGAGGLMMPTVVGGGLAAARRDWSRYVRIVCVIVALPPIVFVGHDLVHKFGWSVRTLAGFLAMLTIYATIIASTRSTFLGRTERRRLSNRTKLVVLAVPASFILFRVLAL